MKKIVKLILSLTLMFGIFMIPAFILYRSGVFSSIDAVKTFGNSLFGYIMFVATYLLAKLLLFPPLGPLVIVYDLVAPSWIVFLLASGAEILGSFILYCFGLVIGTKIIRWILDDKILDKWENVMRRGRYTIFLMLLFPFSPNQLIMMLSGSGRMKMKQYLPMVIIAQPIGVLTTILFGKSVIGILGLPLYLLLPASGILVIGVFSILFNSYKHEERIHSLILKITGRVNNE